VYVRPPPPPPPPRFCRRPIEDEDDDEDEYEDEDDDEDEYEGRTWVNFAALVKIHSSRFNGNAAGMPPRRYLISRFDHYP
jgi:hypothetical protein